MERVLMTENDEQSSEIDLMGHVESAKYQQENLLDQIDDEDSLQLQTIPKELLSQNIDSLHYQQKLLQHQRNNSKSATNYINNNIFLANDELPAYRSSLTFPASRQIYQYVDGRQRLKELILVQLKRMELFIHIKVVQTTAKSKRTIFVVCNSCGKKLLMKYINISKIENNRFKLVHFDNTHIHDNEKSIILKKQLKYKLFLKELNQYKKEMTVYQFHSYLRKKYNISEKDFRYFIYQIQQKKDQEMKALIQFLKRNDSKIWAMHFFDKKMLMECQQYDDTVKLPKDPQFFMFSLPYMAQYCKQFSRICYINIIEGFIINKTEHGIKNWEIITFSGLTNFNDLAPFAITFLQTKQHSIETITLVICKFMKEFNTIPEIIITPYSPFYIDLMNNLRKQSKFIGLHFYDSICYLQTVGEQIDNILDRIHYQKIILSKNRREFKVRCSLLFERVQATIKNMQAFNNLIDIAPKMCFAEIETDQFIGMIFRFSANKNLLNLIRHIFTKAKVKRAEQNIEGQKQYIVRKKWRNSQPTLTKSIFLVSRSIIKYNNSLSTDAAKKAGYCQWRCENYMDMPQLQNIRVNIKKEYLHLILQQYGLIFQMEIAQRDLKDPSKKQMKIFDIYDKKLKTIFVVSARPELSEKGELLKFIWKCNCLYSSKCGLPCAHEIKVIVLTETSLYDQIHQMWLKKRQYPTLLKKRGRNKGTRRNTQK